jgi:hypothetical protein
MTDNRQFRVVTTWSTDDRSFRSLIDWSHVKATGIALGTILGGLLLHLLLWEFIGNYLHRGRLANCIDELGYRESLQSYTATPSAELQAYCQSSAEGNVSLAQWLLAAIVIMGIGYALTRLYEDFGKELVADDELRKKIIAGTDIAMAIIVALGLMSAVILGIQLVIAGAQLQG